jgi:adenylate cyclase
MIARSKLPLFTLLAVFLSIIFVGIFVTPAVLKIVKQNFYRMQADVNYRQAKAMANFMQTRIAEGVPQDRVISEFQASIEDTQFDRGYVCVVDQKSTKYLCHPMTQALGMSVADKKALYDNDFDGKNYIKWEESIQAGESGTGLLHYKESKMNEVVYFQSLEGVRWTVSSHENTARMVGELKRVNKVIVITSFVFAIVLAVPVSFAARRVSRRYEDQILQEQAKSDNLLLNILPEATAIRMKKNEDIIVDHYKTVSVLFCDIVNFTPLSAQIGPVELVKLLNRVFTEFDNLCQTHKIEKIKTIGDGYMAVSGVPEPNYDHAAPLANMALEMLWKIKQVDAKLDIRIGIHTGDVIAGVIGSKKFSFDLWGDTVNTAARLESHGTPGKIHCSQEYFESLNTTYAFEDCGLVEIKGKGDMHTYFLTGPRQ